MHYYLALTSKCNLNCKYCYGKSVEDFLPENELEKYDLDLPDEINYTVQTLKKFSKTDPNFQITFYGGEPLLKIDKITQIMDEFPEKEFMIQTNAIFLNKLPIKYLPKINTILASIDGTKEHTNERRGKGVYEKVLKNIDYIKENGFKGEIIARMTVDETCDIYENVTHLLSLSQFDSVHWQIDALFWEADYKQRDFKRWAIQDYNPKIKNLAHWWLEQITKTRSIPNIYPFKAIIYTLLTGEKIKMRCGAGHSVLGLQTNGKISACPITAGYKPLYMGDINKSTLSDIQKNTVIPSGPCLNCEIKDICGGRCLYSNKTMLWGEKGHREVCDTIFFLVNTMKSLLPEINKLIVEKKISIENFNYPRHNGTEIIP